jgi:hypothetical protein
MEHMFHDPWVWALVAAFGSEAYSWAVVDRALVTIAEAG